MIESDTAASDAQSFAYTPNPNDNFPSSFSAKQISCPVVIEIFSGGAAALKVLGFSGSFGVDHRTDTTISTLRKADLTTSFGQKLLLTWLNSPLVVGVFVAPPCGACSLARTIQIRDAKRSSNPRTTSIAEFFLNCSSSWGQQIVNVFHWPTNYMLLSNESWN